MHQCGYLSSINYFSYRRDEANTEPKATSLLSTRDRNTKDISHPKVLIILTIYLARLEINLPNQRTQPDTTVEMLADYCKHPKPLVLFSIQQGPIQ